MPEISKAEDLLKHVLNVFDKSYGGIFIWRVSCYSDIACRRNELRDKKSKYNKMPPVNSGKRLFNNRYFTAFIAVGFLLR